MTDSENDSVLAHVASVVGGTDAGAMRTLAESLKDNPTYDAERELLLARAASTERDHRGAISHFLKVAAHCETSGDREGLARAQASLGREYLNLSMMVEAREMSMRAAHGFTDLGMELARSKVDIDLGHIHIGVGDFNAALQCFNRAIDHFSSIESGGGNPNVVDALMGAGYTYRRLGQHDDALRAFNAVLEIGTRTGDVNVRVNALSGAGAIHLARSEYHEVMTAFLQAMELSEASGDDALIASSYEALGLLYAKVGELDTAESYFRRTLQRRHSIVDPQTVEIARTNLANVLMEKKQYDEAITEYTVALECFREMELTSSVVWLLGELASAHAEAGHMDVASSLLDEQERLEGATPEMVVQASTVRATIAIASGDYQKANALLTDALQMAQDHSYRSQVAEIHFMMRDVAKTLMDFEGYMHHNEVATQLQSEIHDRETMQRISMMEAERSIQSERQEREKERALLYGALPEHIATRMLRGETIEDHFDNAAVLFADIAGFTTHTSSMHPSETITLLEGLYKTFDAICAEHGVTKVKTIGDSYLCFAHESGEGLSVEGLEVANRVAAVALAMQNAEFYWPTSDEQRATSNRIQLRIGMHAGPVSAGVIGTQRLQYDVWGDTVNVASRMESTGEPGRIQVSSEFHEQLSNRVGPSHSLERGASEGGGVRFWTTERGSIDIKGKGTMTTYWLEQT